MSLDEIVEALQRSYGANQVELRSSDCFIIFASAAGSNLRIAIMLTPRQAEFLASHPVPSEDLVLRRFPPGWPVAVEKSQSPSSGSIGYQARRYQIDYLVALETLRTNGMKVEDPYVLPNGTRHVRVDEFPLTDEQVLNAVSGHGGGRRKLR
jgi:hypothetical protein